MKKRKTHEEYCIELQDKGIKYIPMEKYVSTHTNILHYCPTCKGYWKARPSNILSNYGCPYCANSKVLVGFNDMWTTNSDLAKLLLNSEDGYKYTQMSNTKVNWKCPDCNFIIKHRMINNINQQGLSCPKCSDGLSIPFKFVCNVLSAVKEDFNTEVAFDWSQNKRFDIYIKSKSLIIEVNGGQHYDTYHYATRGRSLDEEKKNDFIKKKLSIDNNIKHYKYINAQITDFKLIKKSIIDELSAFYDFTTVDFKQCFKKAQKSKVIEICKLWNKGYTVAEIFNIEKLSKPTICRYLNLGTKLNICDYNGLESVSIKVVCLNSNEIFNSMKEASAKYNIGARSISRCCKNKALSAGRYNNEKLVWMYYKDYITKSDDEIRQYIDNKKLIPYNSKKIICLTTGEIFNTIKDASEWCNMSSVSTISACLSKKYKYAGKHPVSGEKLKWMHYEDYIKLNNNINESGCEKTVTFSI